MLPIWMVRLAFDRTGSAAAGRAKKADAARATAATPEVMIRFIMSGEKHSQMELHLKAAFTVGFTTVHVCSYSRERANPDAERLCLQAA